jgi:hypothetical protein
MSIRLTESRLRQIIREELTSLRESDAAAAAAKAEGLNLDVANDHAAKEGYSHYIDVEIKDTKIGRLSRTPLHNDLRDHNGEVEFKLTDKLGKPINDVNDVLNDLHNIMPILIMKEPSFVARIYGSVNDLKKVSELLPVKPAITSIRGPDLSMEVLAYHKDAIKTKISSMPRSRDVIKDQEDQNAAIQSYVDKHLVGKTIKHRGEMVEVLDWEHLVPDGSLFLSCLTQDGREVQVSI